MATVRSTEGMPVYPKAAPPSRVVRGEELQDLFRAVKGVFHELVNCSCTSGKNGTEGGHWEPAQPPPRNQSCRLEESGHGGGFHMSLTFSAARESIAVISGSGSDNATTPEGDNAAESSYPEREREPSDAAIDIRSSGEHRRTRMVTFLKTSLKRRDHCVAFLKKCSFSGEAHRRVGHHTLLVWLSAGRWTSVLVSRTLFCLKGEQ